MSSALIDRVRDGFQGVFGRDFEGIWSAPGRASLAGDHTDAQDGLSFGFAIAQRTAVAVARRDDDAITIATDLIDERATARLSTLHPDQGMDDWKAYPLGMIWAVVEHARTAAAELDDPDVDPAAAIGTGLDVFLSTDLPIGGGLASSASVCAALGVALTDLWALELEPIDIATLGARTEVSAAGAATGLADHISVLVAKEHHDVFFDVRGRDVSLIPMPDLASADLVTLAVDTREVHRNWSSPFLERQDSCARVAQTLGKQTLREARLDELEEKAGELDPTDVRRARHVITEIQRTLEFTRILRTEGPLHAGPILRESQASLRDDFEVSTARIDATCALAEQLGAVGARMIGSGLGGSVFVLLADEHVDALTAACRDLYAENGWPEPRVLRISASDGARRDA